MECICTCARAHPLSINVPLAVSRKRLGRLRWNLVCTWEPISYSLCSSHWWGTSARAHVYTALLYLTNGSIDWVQFWCASSGSWTRCLSHVMGGVGISARAHVQTALLYLRNGSADWVQFWCVSWVSWTRCLTQVMGGVSLHVRTCTPRFCISGTARPIVLKFGMLVGGH